MSNEPENLTNLNEALRQARSNQRRYWVLMLVWLALAITGVVVFSRITDQFEQSSQQVVTLKRELTAAQADLKRETERLAGDVRNQEAQRNKLAEEIAEKMRDFEKSQNNSDALVARLRSLQERAEGRLDTFSQEAKDKLGKAERQLGDLKEETAAQKKTIETLMQYITAARADAQKVAINQTELTTQLERKFTELASQSLSAPNSNPDGDPVALRLASGAMRAIEEKNYPAAIDALDQAVTETRAPALRVKLLGLRAMVKSFLSLDNSALIDVNEALAGEPGKPDLLIVRAQVYHDLGKWPDAKDDLKKALEANPENARAWHDLGHIYLKHEVNDENKAVKDFTRALDIKHDYPDALIERALALMLLGKHEEAAADLERAMALATTGPDSAPAVARVKEVQAIQALMRNRPDEAFVLAYDAYAERREQMWTVFALATATREARAPVLAEKNVKRAMAEEYFALFNKLAQKSEGNVAYLRRFLPDRTKAQLKK